MSEHRDEQHHIADELAADAMDDRALLDALAKEIRTGNPQPVHFQIDWLTAWSLLAAVQLACRHEGFTGPTRTMVEQLARQLGHGITLGPISEEIIARGWKDVSPAEAPSAEPGAASVEG